MTQTATMETKETNTAKTELKEEASMTDPKLTGMQNQRTPVLTKDASTGMSDAVMKVHVLVRV